MKNEKKETAPLTGGPVDRSVRPTAWIGEGLLPITPEDLEKTRNREPGFATLYDTPLYAIPEGWQLVPKELTNNMVKDVARLGDAPIWEVYRVMLEAAPKPNV